MIDKKLFDEASEITLTDYGKLETMEDINTAVEDLVFSLKRMDEEIQKLKEELSNGKENLDWDNVDDYCDLVKTLCEESR